jgi:hypothetical protein
MGISLIDTTNFENGNLPIVSVYDIFGVDKGTVNVTDHPRYINPRTCVREEIVDAVAEQTTIDDPILIYKDAGEDKFILLDGRNRLTGRLAYLKQNPDDAEAEFIPAVVFKGDYTSARAVQITRNLPDRKSSLTDQEVTLAVKRMKDDEGLSPEEIRGVFGWFGKSGTRNYNKYVAISELDDVVLEKFVDGKISTAVAKAATLMTKEAASNFVDVATNFGPDNDSIIETITGVKLSKEVTKARKSDIQGHLTGDLIYALTDAWLNKAADYGDFDTYIFEVTKKCIASRDMEGMFVLMDDVKLLQQILDYLTFLNHPNLSTAEEAIETVYNYLFSDVERDVDKRLKRVINFSSK